MKWMKYMKWPNHMNYQCQHLRLLDHMQQLIAPHQKAEQLIYDTPFEDEDSYGPIYYEPPLKLNKIYEEFEGKRFRKLYHHEIRFAGIYDYTIYTE